MVLSFVLLKLARFLVPVAVIDVNEARIVVDACEEHVLNLLWGQQGNEFFRAFEFSVTVIAFKMLTVFLVKNTMAMPFVLVKLTFVNFLIL